MHYYISKNYKAIYGASGKAKTDFEYALQKIGFKNLGFKQSCIPNSAIGAIKNFFGITWALIRLPRKAVLCTQYPINKYRNYILFIARLKNCKIITLVHDVGYLRKRTKNKENELIKVCNSDAIIVHNPNMKQWFLDQGINIPIIVLGIFDYVANELPKQNITIEHKSPFNLVYAGGYGGNKNSYVYDVDNLKTNYFNLKLYGTGFEPEKRKVNEAESSVFYAGVFPSNEIAYKIKGDFGLVWDGESVNTCSGQYGEYLKFNNPHKTSLYILCGLPIVIWEEAALAPFIKENNLGITISSLAKLDEAFNKLSFQDIATMKKNVLKFQQKVISGSFYKAAVKMALEKIRMNR